ncbi:MAG: hypothetical protein LHV68_03300 [Elusimicrobia bacterium]|nr:hypothetical protein [Candidatus Liberimonas magnetica]
MPLVRELVRKRTGPRMTLSGITRSIQIMLVIVLVSMVMGWISIILSNYLNPRAKVLQGFGSGKISWTENYKDKIINQYKDKYGSDWQNKLKENYKNYIK